MHHRILSGCITAWYGSCSAQDRKELQKVVNVARSITQTSLPSTDSLSTLPAASEKQPAYSRTPEILSSTFFHRGKRYRSLRSRTNRLKNSFFPAAVRCLNGPTLIFLYTLAMTVTLHSAISHFLLYERYALSV